MTNRDLIVLLTAVFTVLSGCASNPAGAQRATAQTAGGPQADGDFYEGVPDVLFATEFPVESAEEAIQRGDTAYVSGEIDLALYMYVRAYDLESDNLHALSRIARIHESRANSNLATRAYLAMLNVDPANAEALEALGLIYLKARKHEDAEALFERAVEEDPARWRAHNGLGVIADIRGEHQVAVLSYDEALVIRPNDPVLLNNRGYSHYLAGDYQSAGRDLYAAAEGGVERAWINLGLVMAREGWYSDAMQYMQRATDAAVAFNDVGYIAMRQGNDEIAELYFEKAIELSPRHFDAATRNLEELRAANAEENPTVVQSAARYPGD